jgi:glucokinase
MSSPFKKNRRRGAERGHLHNGIGPARPALLKEMNAREVLRVLRQDNPCSRADLVRLTGLTAPTVSAAVERLIDEDLVEPVGFGSSSGGRRPNMLRFNASYAHVLAVDLGGTTLRIALADMNGTILGKWSGSSRSASSPEQVIALIRVGMERVTRQAGLPMKAVKVVAAGNPGITDVDAGIVISAPNLKNWRNVPFRNLLESALGIAAVVENDVNLAAMGENWRGAARDVSNFVFLALGTGIGAGIYLNGEIIHGADWAAGEVGYMHVPGTPDTAFALDKEGSLESVIGGRGIEQAWRNKLRDTKKKLHRNLPASLSATEIFELGREGDPIAAEILNRVSHILADAILNISLIVNCSLVVLGGGVGLSTALYDMTRRRLDRNELLRPQLVLSTLGQDAQLVGAVRLALDLVEVPVAGARKQSSRANLVSLR